MISMEEELTFSLCSVIILSLHWKTNRTLLCITLGDASHGYSTFRLEKSDVCYFDIDKGNGVVRASRGSWRAPEDWRGVANLF